MFWNKKIKPIEIALEEKTPEPIITFGSYDKFLCCEKCSWVAMSEETIREICPNCGHDTLVKVIGRWSFKWRDVLYFGVLVRHEFHRKVEP